MRIAGVESTDLFVGTAQRPLQVVRVTLEGDGTGPAATVHVQGPGVRSPGPFGISDLSPGEQKTYEVPVEIAVPYQPGSTRRVTVTVETAAGRVASQADITAADPGWTMWMVSHFHYDPVWWNTQGQFAEARLTLPDEDGALPDVRAAFELVRVHLDKARTDPDYKFVLAEIDYLKPYFDLYPADRADLRALLADGRLEIVGGNYNEPSTNLTSAESTIRNAVYGIGFQREVLGGDPQSAWMLDVFGHDPGYPGLMAAAGLTSSAWARGPFHQWGPAGTEGGIGRMQFRSEFEWLSPDGHGLLTAYMAHHYGAGWKLHTLPDLAAAEAEAYAQFRALARVAASRNVMLPVGSDHVIPARWVTDIHRDWNQRYVWPRFTTAVPREFFDAVRAEATPAGAGPARTWITPQTRDMNPVYTGKDVSYIDTKQAQRAIETAVAEAERFATLAWLDGAPFPHAALDKAWRLLAYGAHHDGITGVESDQVYLDLLGGWREAWELGSGARRDAVARLSRTAGPAVPGGPAALGGRAVRVFNGLARARDDRATVTVSWPVADAAGDTAGGPRWAGVQDEAGAPVPALAEGVRRREDGSLAEMTLTFLARDVPALGGRTYQVVPAAEGDPAAAGAWREVTGGPLAIQNGRYLVTADAARGGTVAVTDRRTGASLLAGPGNELVLQDEYAQHPKHGEGPWHLSPRGAGLGSASGLAAVRVEECPAGRRLVASFLLDGLEVTQETVLWQDADRVEFRTHVDGYRGNDRLLRVRFPADVPGGLPVFQTATAVIGRTFGAVEVDSEDTWYTLDSPAYQWFGLGSAARVRIGGAGGPVQGIGVAEVIVPDGGPGPELQEDIRGLMVALAGAGVTATCSQADGPRYGGLDADSNLPDVRIAVGGPGVNTFTAEVLSGAGPGYAKAVAGGDPARVWVPAGRSRADVFAPNADVRGVADLPVLVVAAGDPAELATAVRDLAGDLADALIDGVEHPGEGGERQLPVPLADWSVALLNRGTPGGVVTPDGTLHMSLMRSCSAWPSRIWIDGEPRTAPDGSSFAWQHWSHTFEYALVSGPGDWRAAGFTANAEAYNHDLITVLADPADTRADVLSVEPANVTLTAVKPHGNPLAAGRSLAAIPGGAEDALITVRLRETAGRATAARVRLDPGTVSVRAAARGDLLETTSDGAPLPVADGVIAVDVPAFGTVTLVVRAGPPGPAAAAPPGPAEALAPVEPVQPVYARYWLHGKGPAPAGNLPVAVHFTEPRVALRDPGGRAEPGQAVPATLTVSCGPDPARGTVELTAPAGIIVAAPRELSYDLEAGRYAAWDLAIRAEPQTRPGRYFVAARITDDHGQVIEDTIMAAVGERRWPDPELPPEDALEVMQADFMAGAAELELAIAAPELRVAPGGQGEVLLTVTSRVASAVHGEVQLVSPFGSWEMLWPAVQGFHAAPGEPARLTFAVTAPATARPGSRWWALAKVMYFGRVRYSQAIPISIEAG